MSCLAKYMAGIKKQHVDTLSITNYSHVRLGSNTVSEPVQDGFDIHMCTHYTLAQPSDEHVTAAWSMQRAPYTRQRTVHSSTIVHSCTCFLSDVGSHLKGGGGGGQGLESAITIGTGI